MANPQNRHGFFFYSPISAAALALVASALAASIGAGAALLVDACSAGFCP